MQRIGTTLQWINSRKNTTFYNSIKRRHFILTFVFAVDDSPFTLSYGCTLSILRFGVIFRYRAVVVQHMKRERLLWCMELSFIINFIIGIFPDITLLFTLFSFNYTIHPLLAIYCNIRVFLAHFDNIYSRYSLYIL